MKIALLSGAYKNAGDFLIVKRSKELLKYVYADCEIEEFLRKNSLTDDLDRINNMDCLVIAGGPAYIRDVYPNMLPLTNNLKDIKIPIFALANGWSGISVSSDVLYNYNFTSKDMELFSRIEEDGFPLGCRDWESVRVLENAGVKKAVMTGCVAWYNLEHIDRDVLRLDMSSIKKICISDPALALNIDSAYELAKYMKKRYPQSDITFVFHRGTTADEHTSDEMAARVNDLKKKVEAIGVECCDISYGADGFSIYDNCDLHIGFRVHAHIYNLSCRNASILIEEDSRGGGVNGALKLPGIRAYETKCVFSQNKVRNKLIRKYGVGVNPYLIKEVDDWLNYLERTDYMDFGFTFKRMQEYFKTMINHIKLIENAKHL